MKQQQSKQFIDKLRIYVKAGAGSAGNPKIRGKGGDGGSIYLQVLEDRHLSDIALENPKKRFIARSGRMANSRRGICLSANAEDVYIPVPPGISVSISSTAKNAAGSRFMGDLNEIGQKMLVAKGGQGGIPVTNYLGSPGQAHSLVLDLKLMADIGLIGLPNAGKSSLLQSLSGTKAKIASYPFTTLRPQIANFSFPDHRQISLADLPGLADIAAKFDLKNPSKAELSQSCLEDDSKLPPLTHTAFLKHVERTSCILIVLDALGFQANQHSPYRSPLASAMLLISQLQRYSFGRLLGKPLICAINKIDLPNAMDLAEETKEALLNINTDKVRLASGLPNLFLPRHSFHFEDVFLVSAQKKQHLNELKSGLRHWLDVFELKKRESDFKEATNLAKETIKLSLCEHLPKLY